jgi:hypothetical protein
MDESPRTWQWVCPAPLREDADSVFVPRTAVPDAKVGDTIVVRAESGGEARTGTITATSKDDGEVFFRVAVEQ